MDLTPLFPELSARRVNILKAISHGMTNEYIAGIENISERTVEYHVGELIHALGIGLAPGSRSINPRTRLAHLFYNRVINAMTEVIRGS